MAFERLVIGGSLHAVVPGRAGDRALGDTPWWGIEPLRLAGSVGVGGRNRPHDVRRVHRLVAGETLASVAYAEYGDPTQWRPLAAYNGIDDPMRLRPGATLMLPTPEELAG